VGLVQVVFDVLLQQFLGEQGPIVELLQILGRFRILTPFVAIQSAHGLKCCERGDGQEKIHVARNVTEEGRCTDKDGQQTWRSAAPCVSDILLDNELVCAHVVVAVEVAGALPRVVAIGATSYFPRDTLAG
jgi:hypothetical protein